MAKNKLTPKTKNQIGNSGEMVGSPTKKSIIKDPTSKKKKKSTC